MNHGQQNVKDFRSGVAWVKQKTTKDTGAIPKQEPMEIEHAQTKKSQTKNNLKDNPIKLTYNKPIVLSHPTTSQMNPLKQRDPPRYYNKPLPLPPPNPID